MQGRTGQDLLFQPRPKQLAGEPVSAAKMVLALFPAVPGALVPVTRPVHREPPRNEGNAQDATELRRSLHPLKRMSC